ncbi:MAG: PH domain-containing protein [Anaerolineae bacterium]|nr:PH domain-containing protein [Thermoflexales bacterium]MDW8406201.1 PH domain-containing protein [Anaerolineae bacterium]
MVVFTAPTRPALIAGIAAMAAACAVLFTLLALAVALPKSLLTFVLITLALGLALFIGWAGWHTYALTHTSYAIDRNAFVIRYGPIRQVIPMGEVQRVIAGSDIAPDMRLLRLPLPGWWIGRGEHPALGKIDLFSTLPLERQIIIVTQAGAYGVSPASMEDFVEAFRVRFQMGPTQLVQPARLQPAFMKWSIWKSPITLGLIVAPIVLNALVFAVSFALFPSLPEQIALHFDASGAPDRFGSPAQIFGPGLIGLGLLIVNLALGAVIYRGERLAAYLIWGGSSGIQLALLVATLTLAFSQL